MPKGPKLGQKLGFLPFSQVWFFTLKLYAIIAYNNVYYLVEIKATKNFFGGGWVGGQFWAKTGQKLGFQPFSQVWFISFP